VHKIGAGAHLTSGRIRPLRPSASRATRRAPALNARLVPEVVPALAGAVEVRARGVPARRARASCSTMSSPRTRRRAASRSRGKSPAPCRAGRTRRVSTLRPSTRRWPGRRRSSLSGRPEVAGSGRGAMALQHVRGLAAPVDTVARVEEEADRSASVAARSRSIGPASPRKCPHGDGRRRACQLVAEAPSYRLDRGHRLSPLARPTSRRAFASRGRRCETAPGPRRRQDNLCTPGWRAGVRRAKHARRGRPA